MISGESNQVAELFVGVLSALLAALFGWFSYEKRKAKETVESHSERLTKIEAEMMTETKTKELINESLGPLREDIREVKEHMRKMSEDMLYIRLEIAKSSGYTKGKEDNR